MTKRIFLIRHGESLQNQQDLLSGTTDVQLSSEGKAQCKRLRSFFRRIPVDEVFASPLTRAIESARLIFPDHSIVIAEDLIEFDYGDYEGVPRSHEDEIMRLWNTKPGEVKFPGGKSVQEHAEQVYEGLLKIASRSSGQVIAGVSHRTTIRLIVAKTIRLDLNYFRLLPCSNCGVTVFSFEESSGLRLEALNLPLEYLVE